MIASKLLNLVPSVISSGVDISYDDLVRIMKSEVLRWKANKVQTSNRETIKHLCSVTLGMYSACHLLWANSTLKNLKSYTMRQERLSSLALMHVHYKIPVDLDDVVTRFKLNATE